MVNKRQLLVFSGVILVIFFTSIEFTGECHKDTIYFHDDFNKLYHSSTIIVKARPVGFSFYNQNPSVDSYRFSVNEIFKGKCEKEITVWKTSDHVNNHSFCLTEPELARCELILFLAPFGEQYLTLGENIGVFVVYNDEVFSYGELDEDYSFLTFFNTGGQAYEDFIAQNIR